MKLAVATLAALMMPSLAILAIKIASNVAFYINPCGAC